MKELIKRVLYRIKILSIFHRYRNRNVLTVIMLHRIVPAELLPQYGANPEWTVSPRVFEDMLIFFKKHYSVISINDLDEANTSGKALPHNPLLITLDDGWKDNFDYAFPILKKYDPIQSFLYPIAKPYQTRGD